MPVVGRTTGVVALSLDGKPCGSAKSVAGGDISAPVIEEQAGPTGFVLKHLGPPVYEELTLQVGLGMGPAFYDWIAATWTRNFARKSGSIAASDVNLQVKTSREFTNALITETTIPALDGASKDAALLTVKLAPELISSAAPSGALPAPPADKKWLAANFRLELDGLDCTKVSKIDSFTVTVETVAAPIGEDRQPIAESAVIHFPNLAITLAESSAQTWIDWFADFVVKGNNDESKEKGGAIVFLAPDMKTELGRVTLHNVGICALRHPVLGPTAAQIPRLTAELYCERMELQVGAGSPVVPPQPVIVVPHPRPPIEPGRVVG